MAQREGTPRIPVLPVRDLVLFPGIIVPLFVGRPRSLKALEEAMLGEKTVFVVAQKELGSEDPGPEDFLRRGDSLPGYSDGAGSRRYHQGTGGGALPGESPGIL